MEKPRKNAAFTLLLELMMGFEPMNLCLTKAVLYLLSYISIFNFWAVEHFITKDVLYLLSYSSVLSFYL